MKIVAFIPIMQENEYAFRVPHNNIKYIPSRNNKRRNASSIRMIFHVCRRISAKRRRSSFNLNKVLPVIYIPARLRETIQEE